MLSIFIVVLGFFLFGLEVNAFYVNPPSDLYTYVGRKLEAVDNPYICSEYYNDGYDVEQDWTKYSSSTTNDEYFRVLSLKKPVCISIKSLSGVPDYMNSGDTLEFVASEVVSTTRTHEEIFTSTIGQKISNEASFNLIGIDFVEVGGAISQEIYSEISVEITQSTSYTASKSFELQKSHTALKNGYYCYEYRTHFNMYIIQKAMLTYDVVNNKRTSLPPKVYVEANPTYETFLRCIGGDFTRVVRYNKVNASFELCVEDFNDNTCYYW